MTNSMTSRRQILAQGAALMGTAASGLLVPQHVLAQSGKIRVGFMLPYTGTYAQLGVAIENGVRLAIDQQGGKLGGREIGGDEGNAAHALGARQEGRTLELLLEQRAIQRVHPLERLLLVGADAGGE